MSGGRGEGGKRVQGKKRERGGGEGKGGGKKPSYIQVYVYSQLSRYHIGFHSTPHSKNHFTHITDYEKWVSCVWNFSILDTTNVS